MGINITISFTRFVCIILILLIIFLFVYRQPFVVFIDRKLKTTNTIDDLYGNDALILTDTKAKDVNCEKRNPYEIGMEKEHFNEFFYNRGGVSPEIFNIILPDFSKARKMELEYSIVENSKVNGIDIPKKWFDDENPQNFYFNQHKLFNELKEDDLFDPTIEFSTGKDSCKLDWVKRNYTERVAEIRSTERVAKTCSTESDELVTDNMNQSQPLDLSIGQVVITVMKNNGNFTEQTYSNSTMNRPKGEIDDYEVRNFELENDDCDTEEITTYPCFTVAESCRSTAKRRKTHLKEIKKSNATRKKHTHVNQIIETEELTTSTKNLLSTQSFKRLFKKQRKSVKRGKNHKNWIEMENSL